jgi:hypothetical protein
MKIAMAKIGSKERKTAKLLITTDHLLVLIINTNYPHEL